MTQQLDQTVKYLRLDVLDRIERLKPINEKLKLPVSQIALILLVIISILALILEAHIIFIGVVCFLVPAYLSFTSLENEDREKSVKYLTYWIVFSLQESINPILEFILDPIVYLVMRILLTFAMLHPQVELSMKIYKGIIEPVFIRKEESIDAKVEELKEKGK